MFLSEREKDTETATLVACGAGGIVQFWNIFGGGLIGEFKVFDSGSRIVSSIEESELNSLHCVTACRAHSNNLTLITGTTLGHIQVKSLYLFFKHTCTYMYIHVYTCYMLPIQYMSDK